MRHASYKDNLNSHDRKRVRRIFLQISSIYMSLIIIAVAGVAAKSVLAAWPDTNLSQRVGLR
jgi:hypothetical protein